MKGLHAGIVGLVERMLALHSVDPGTLPQNKKEQQGRRVRWRQWASKCSFACCGSSEVRLAAIALAHAHKYGQERGDEVDFNFTTIAHWAERRQNAINLALR